MKKGNKFNVMSDRKCTCGKPIKQNIVDRKAVVTKCYNCDRLLAAANGNIISTAREVRTGARIGRKKGIYAPPKPAATR
jgi:hypothetical protein